MTEQSRNPTMHKFFGFCARVLLGGLLLLTAANFKAFGAATEASLVLANETATPDSTLLAGVRLQMKPGWHIYWRNPGGSGIATRVTWELPEGVTAGDLQWPTPEVLPAKEFTTFIYEKEVVLLVPLKIAASAAIGPLHLKAHVTWLECQTQCVPAQADIATTLTIGTEVKAGTNAAWLQTWQHKVPLSQPGFTAKAWWELTSSNDVRYLDFQWPGTDVDQSADFYPYPNEAIDVSFEHSSAMNNGILLRKLVKRGEGDWPNKIAGVLIDHGGGITNAHEINLSVTTNAPMFGAVPMATNPETIPGKRPKENSLFFYLVYAFIGGLILNIMPCVLPVIALKILGFVQQGGEHPKRVRKLGLIYAAGVLFSFLVLAGMVIGVKAAGNQAGWGMQFGNAKFLVVMTVLVTLVALNLFGLFEVNLSGKVMGTAGNLSAKEGAGGAFFNGVLATILATPCSAPFLGVALGFAFAQSYAVITFIFLAVGLGLALPYVVLSWNPALLKLLPRPGLWMEKFKMAMGFPMLATAVWLLDLTAAHYGRKVLWLGLFLVMLAMAAWIYGEFVQRGSKRRTLSVVTVLALLVGGYWFALEDNLHWRAPMIESENGVIVANEPDGIPWQRWSHEAVEQAVAAGHPVLVDFTADWCQVCQVNRKTSIETKSVADKIKQLKVVALVADYTKLPPAMGKELNRFGRAAVPLVLVYPGKAGAEPEILPDGYLTPGIVLGALDRAAKIESAAAK